jgi:hypothetical protein
VVGFYNCCQELMVFTHKDAVGSTRMVTYWNGVGVVKQVARTAAFAVRGTSPVGKRELGT